MSDDETYPLRPALRLRYNAWRAVVLGTFACNLIFALGHSPVAAIGATGLLLAMAMLLATTPTDAIRLPRSRSERIIAIGFALAAALATHGRLSAIGIAVLLLVAGFAELAFARKRDFSPWWIAVLLWQPWWLVAIHAAAARP